QEIGALPTVVLLLVESALGAWLVKREGRRAWLALRTGAASGRLPSGELADAALVLIGGTLLLAPGFVTDIAGFLLVLPLTRPLARRLVAWYLARRATQVARHRPGSGTTGRVVPGEVLRPGDTGSGDSDGSGPTEDPGRAAGG
ncbi:MAG: FxsA family protein, partial [Actinomycetes bacterium]